MTTKKILRKVLRISYWIMFCLLIVRAIFGLNTIFGNIVLVVYCIDIAYDIKEKIIYNRTFKDYKKLFYRVEDTHKIRYYLYFSGSESEVERYSRLVEYGCQRVLVSGQYLLKDKYASKGQKKVVQDIIDKTKRLKENIQPPV